MASQMINNSWRNSRLKLQNFMVIRITNHGHSSDFLFSFDELLMSLRTSNRKVLGSTPDRNIFPASRGLCREGALGFTFSKNVCHKPPTQSFLGDSYYLLLCHSLNNTSFSILVFFFIF